MRKIIFLLLALIAVGLAFERADLYYRKTIAEDETIIVVNKQKKHLTLYEAGNSYRYPIATGKNTGDKQMVGDMRTPEGIFHIISIEPSATWTFDFEDGLGPIAGAYGPWFLRFDGPWEGIAIHGTHDESTLGQDITHGCIRMRNADLLDLKEKVTVGCQVVVLP